MQTQDRPIAQSLETSGGNIINKIKELVHEGNIRKISIKQDGRTVAEFPLTFGVVGAALAPALAAIGAITALLTDCTIEVEHAHPPTESSPTA
jgi:Domain of unknown function (DUF4342)